MYSGYGYSYQQPYFYNYQNDSSSSDDDNYDNRSRSDRGGYDDGGDQEDYNGGEEEYYSPPRPRRRRGVPRHMRINSWPRLYFDGSALGNPGPGGAGAVLYGPRNGPERWRSSVPLGSYVTNNEAEYRGLIQGLEDALDCGYRNLWIMGDSQLVINHLTGVYRVRSQHLRQFYDTAMQLLLQFDDYELQHIRREHNTTADWLAQEAAQQS